MMTNHATGINYRDEWIAYLLSGNYKQGIGRLKDLEDRYCCLGVAACVLIDSGKGEWRESAREDADGFSLFPEPFYHFHNDLQEETLETVLDQSTLELFGLTDSEQSILISLNDGCSDDELIKLADGTEKWYTYTLAPCSFEQIVEFLSDPDHPTDSEGDAEAVAIRYGLTKGWVDVELN